MPAVVLPAVPAGPGPEGGLAARVAAGPGLWEDEEWLSELRRDGMVSELLAGGVLARAAAEGGHGCRIERALTAVMILLCLVTGALFASQSYAMVLARAFAMPGARVRPGTPVPTPPALSQARARLGEQPARLAFELDAARDDVPLCEGGALFGLELVIFDGTTLDLHACPELAAEFGVPEGGTRPQLRVTALLQAGTMRWRAAAVGGYHDGENALADQPEGALRPGQLSLADRGFFSMDRWIRFSATGAHLLWRAKNGARSVPFRHLRTLKDGSELVLLRESAGMLGKRRRDAGNRALPRHPDTVARLVCFTILTTTRSGRTKKAEVRVLTTLLDPDAFPAREIAAGYARRWQVETAFLHLKRTIRGAGRELRGQSPGARPPGSLGAAPRPQHDRCHGRPRSARGRDRHRRRLPRRRPRPRPRPRHRRHMLPPLRKAPLRHRRPARAPHHSHRRPATEQGKQETDIRKDQGRAQEMANRGSHLRPHDNPVKPPTSGHKSENLRAVGFEPLAPHPLFESCKVSLTCGGARFRGTLPSV